MYPLMQSGIAPFLLLLSVGVIITQTILGYADWHVLWVNWLVAGAISWSCWDFIDRYRMGRSTGSSLIMVEWFFVAGILNIGAICFPVNMEYWRLLVAVVGFWLFVRMVLGSWQERHASVRYLLCGLVLGLLSLVFPHSLEWIILLPFASFFMRSLDMRSFMSALTGVVLGIWVNYCVLHFFGPEGANRALFDSYVSLVEIQGIDLEGLGIWQMSAVGLMAFLLILYTILGFFFNSGGSLRSHTTVVMFSVLAVIMVLLLLINLQHLVLYLALYALIVSVQMLLVLANSRAVSTEWWTIVILMIVLALGVLPVCNLF